MLIFIFINSSFLFFSSTFFLVNSKEQDINFPFFKPRINSSLDKVHTEDTKSSQMKENTL